MELSQGLIRGTLIFLTHEGRVLLAKKKRKIGIGLWNGYGGGKESNETEREAAVRELWQEGGLKTSPESLQHVATIDFHNKLSNGQVCTVRVDVFTLETSMALELEQAGHENDEMGPPKLFPFNNLPTDQLMLADPIWLPKILRGERIIGTVWYGPGQISLLRPCEFHPLLPQHEK